MAFPTIASSNISSQNSNSTTHTINLPTGITAGDLLIILFACDGDGAVGSHLSTSNPPVSFATGWTTIPPSGESGSGGTFSIRPFCKIATGTEGSQIFANTSSGGSERSAHNSYRISGVFGDLSNNALYWTSNTNLSTASINPPPLSPSWGSDDTLWLTFLMSDANETVTSDPTNYTNEIQINSTNGSAGVLLRSVRRQNATATESPGNFILSASKPATAGIIAVRPVLVDAHLARRMMGGP